MIVKFDQFILEEGFFWNKVKKSPTEILWDRLNKNLENIEILDHYKIDDKHREHDATTSFMFEGEVYFIRTVEKQHSVTGTDVPTTTDEFSEKIYNLIENMWEDTKTT